ncbi:unnamed protein product, partial [Symbiodinium microadriaticum]
MHSWRTMLLPELEQSALHESIQWKALATDNANATVAQTIVPTFICPSGDNPARKGWGLHHDATLDTQSGVAMPEDRYQVTRSDYDAMAGIEVLPNPFPTGANPHSVDYVRWGIWGWAVFDTKTTSGSRLLSYRRGKFRDVTDGLSHTIAIVERAGKPTQLRNGKPYITSDNPLAEYPGQVGWSASNTFAWSFHGDSIGVNASNVRGMFSFHPAGAHVGLADGSVRFLPETTTFDALNEHPNILILIGDDIDRDTLGPWGGAARTPHLDRLAKEGMRLDAVYANVAMCAPFRQELYSGRTAWRTRAMPNHSKSVEGTKSLPHYLEPLGYRVGLLGKTHIGPKDAYPFDYLGDVSKKEDGNPQLVKRATQYITQARDAGKPFCLVVASHDGHGPYTTGDPSQYDAATLPLEKDKIDTPAYRREFQQHLAE